MSIEEKNTINIQQWEKVLYHAQAGDMVDNTSYYPGKIILRGSQIERLEDERRILYLPENKIVFDGFPVDIDHKGKYIILKDGVYEEYLEEKDYQLKRLVEEIQGLTPDQVEEINRELVGLHLEVNFKK